MRKVLFLIILTLTLIACRETSEAPQDLSVADAQATAASEVDGGEEPVVVFQRATDGPESLQEWRIYAGGRVAIVNAAPEGESPANVQVSEAQVDPGAVDTLLQDLESAGFYEAAEPGEQRWNETLDYIISTQVDGDWQSLAIERVTPQTSPVRLQSIGVIEKFLFEALG